MQPEEKRTKDQLADALHALAEGATPSDSMLEEEDETELLAEGFDPNARRGARPLAPELSAPAGAPPQFADTFSPAQLEPTRFDQIIDDDLMEAPAPSEEMLATPSSRMQKLPAAKSTLHRSLFVQRTIIPILLTMGVTLPATAVWLLTLPDDSQLRTLIANLHIYLFVCGAILLVLAMINMISVRSRLANAPAN